LVTSNLQLYNWRYLTYESLQHADLSDWQYVTAQKHDDPHPIEMQVTEMAFGKTNHGQWLYGRAARHKDVRLCSVGGNAFYLASRFHVTREWDRWEDSNWLDKKKWYEIKYLTNMENQGDCDLKSELSSNTYLNAIKEALSSLGLPTNKLLHLGRGLGPKVLELLQIQQEDISRRGNWDPRIQEKCYSTCLPMAAIRGAAGYESNNGMNWNPRSRVDVNDSTLRRATPFGPLEAAYEFIAVHNRNPANNKNKAIMAERFLKCMTCFNTVFLQDAAAMLILHPERADHALFTLACF
jgi:Centromere DNA-binding protein complex CBF3 subunit, domain 2